MDTLNFKNFQSQWTGFNFACSFKLFIVQSERVHMKTTATLTKSRVILAEIVLLIYSRSIGMSDPGTVPQSPKTISDPQESILSFSSNPHHGWMILVTNFRVRIYQY